MNDRLNKLAKLTETLELISIDASMFEQFFYRAPLLCVIADQRGFFVHVNFLWEETFGYQESDLVSHPWLSFVHPDDIQPTVEATEGMANGLPVKCFENRYRSKTGQYKRLRWIATVFNKGVAYCIAEEIK